MKLKIIFFLAMIFLGCRYSPKEDSRIEIDKAMRLDSLKWLFYAYTYQNRVFFDKDDANYEFKPVECSVIIERSEIQGDTIVYVIAPYKKGYNYKYSRGLNVYGFSYIDGAFKPLTGMIKLDNFDSLSFIKNDNLQTDSAFRAYLKHIDHKILDESLFEYSKKK